MRRIGFYFTEILAGGFVYCLIELLFRGYTHESMFVLGGVCFLSIGMIRRGLQGAPAAEKMLLSGIMITVLEFFCGLLVNVYLDLAVWDYSTMPLNLMGQVCMTYSAMWCLLAVPAMGVDMLFCHAWNWGNMEQKKISETSFQTVDSVV